MVGRATRFHHDVTRGLVFQKPRELPPIQPSAFHDTASSIGEAHLEDGR
jgi:hypothetical protein